MNNGFFVRTHGENNVEGWGSRKWFGRYRDKKPVIVDDMADAMMFEHPEMAVEVAADCIKRTGMQFEVVSLKDVGKENEIMKAMLAKLFDVAKEG